MRATTPRAQRGTHGAGPAGAGRVARRGALGPAERAEALVGEAEIAEKALSAREDHVKQSRRGAGGGFSEPKFQAARDRHDRAAHALRAAELAVAETRGELVAAESAVRETSGGPRSAARERTIAGRKIELRLHNTRPAFSDLRRRAECRHAAEISAWRPGSLRSYRRAYDEVDLDEAIAWSCSTKRAQARDLGGEEDIANLVLRLRSPR